MRAVDIAVIKGKPEIVEMFKKTRLEGVRSGRTITCSWADELSLPFIYQFVSYVQFLLCVPG